MLYLVEIHSNATSGIFLNGVQYYFKWGI
uniref:Uncharacterized protein n=1 Tax=Rhizophora mucronata TaxID=61149 RepID=A0A2P2PW70_RHIMU